MVRNRVVLWWMKKCDYDWESIWGEKGMGKVMWEFKIFFGEGMRGK